MSTTANTSCNALMGCPCCGLVQQIPAFSTAQRARCKRCHTTLRRHRHSRGNTWCAALALAALIIYPLAIILPVMQLEKLGHTNETSIWAGSISLMTHGHLFIGIIVVLCSIVIPLVKLIGLLLLCLPPSTFHKKHQATLYHLIELAGRWGMIDVLLVALIIAAVKLGDMVQVTPGPGVIAFGICVVLSLLSAACFNPHAIWKSK